MHPDLLVRGARLLDPGNHKDGRYDVAISNGRVRAVEPNLGNVRADEVVDGTGLLLTPGLIDMHTHVFRGVSYWGIDPDSVAWRTGVTTWVDAGSAGGYSLDGFRELVVDRAAVRIVALVNISAVGLVAESHELQVLENCDVEVVRRATAEHPGLVKGVKVRIDRRTVGRHGLTPLDRALEAGTRCGLPVMAHIGYGPPAVPDVLARLRPGDIVTHCASGIATGIIGPDGQLTDAVRVARDRGVVYDVGHGYAGFAFDVAEAMLAAGAGPDVISSDLHHRSVRGPAHDLPTVLAKLLAIGVSLPDGIAATTSVPARVLGLDDGAGTLSTGAPADMALWRIVEGGSPLVDTLGQPRAATIRLENVATFVAGRRLPERDPEPTPWWVPATPEPLPRPGRSDPTQKAVGVTTLDLDQLLSERIDHRFKGFPDTELTIGEAATAGWNLLAGDLTLPMMVIRQGALEHNLALMADWCSRHGAELAPHGKTTMAPQLYARQLAAGAWGISAATISQVRVMRAVGIGRILLANELVSPAGLRWLGTELDRDEGFELFCYVDSVDGVERLESALDGSRRPLPVLVELGQARGRSGVRDGAEALRLAERVEASARLTLAGGAAYEGLAARDRAPETMAPVDELLERLVRFVEATGASMLSAGGSAYFDRVVAHAERLDARVMLRSGCYLVHDRRNYDRTSPLRGSLREALELWAEVLSAPEPGLAIVGFGKRDAPYDVSLPTPLGLHRPDGRYVGLAGKARVVRLNDQHAFVEHELALRPGDVLRFGLTHPCTAFDKWQLVPIVDDDHTVVEVVRTLF